MQHLASELFRFFNNSVLSQWNFSTMTEYLFVNLYWALYLLPGICVFLWLNRRYPDYKISTLSVALYAFIYTSVLFAPILLIGYFLKFRLDVVLYIFWGLVGASVVFLWRGNYFLQFVSFMRRRITGISLQEISFIKFCFYSLSVLFIMFASLVGTEQYGDAWVHVAKINKNLSNWISYGDPFVDLNTVESRYHLTLLHPIIGLGAKLLDYPAYIVWVHTSAFFNALGIIAIFTSTRYLVRSEKFPYMVTIIWMIFNIGNATQAVYPNKLSTSIFVPLIIATCLIFLRERRPWQYINLMSCILLLAMVHVLYTLFAVILLIVIYAIEFLYVTIRYPQKWLWLSVMLFSILLPAFFLIFTMLQPNYMPKEVYEWGKYEIFHMGEWYAFSPKYIVPGQRSVASFVIITFLIMLGIYLQYRTKEIAKITMIQLFFIIIVVYNANYNPLLVTTLNKWLPLWSIRRSAGVVQLLSLLFLLYVPYKISAINRVKDSYQLFGIILVLIWTAYIQSPVVHKLKKQMSIWERGMTNNYIFSHQLKNYIEPGTVILSDIHTSTLIPAFLNNTVVALRPGHANPAIKGMMDRVSDGELMLNQEISSIIRVPLFKYYNVAYILVNRKEESDCGIVDKRYIANIWQFEGAKSYCLLKLNAEKNRQLEAKINKNDIKNMTELDIAKRLEERGFIEIISEPKFNMAIY